VILLLLRVVRYSKRMDLMSGVLRIRPKPIHIHSSGCVGAPEGKSDWDYDIILNSV
jgi:hypothetical protein